MKKYLLGVFAIAFAIIANSFTPEKKSSTEYYWYDASTLDPLFEGQPTEEFPAGCDISGGDDCAYGHLEPSENPDVDPDITVKFTNE